MNKDELVMCDEEHIPVWYDGDFECPVCEMSHRLNQLLSEEMSKRYGMEAKLKEKEGE